MPRDYKLYLEDILDSIHKIQVYTKDVTFNQLKPGSMLMDALLHNLEIIGEAAKHVPIEIKDKIPMSIGAELRVCGISSHTNILGSHQRSYGML